MTATTLTTTKRFVIFYSGTDLHQIVANTVGSTIDYDDSWSYQEESTTADVDTWLSSQSLTGNSDEVLRNMLDDFGYSILSDPNSALVLNTEKAALKSDLDETGGEE